MNNIDALDGISDHVLFELLKAQDADAWARVYRDAVLTETRGLRSSEVARRWGVCSEELMSMLYEDMIGREKINYYRDEGGSVIGWMRHYVHGYIFRANPIRRHEVSLDTTGETETDDENDFVEKVSWEVSEQASSSALPSEDLARQRQEAWDDVQRCFGTLWQKSPLKAYVHLLKLRSNLSSTEIKDMLGISSTANVDQLFARAIKEMRKLREEE